MSRDQDYLNHISLKLSDVLSDIGVNETMVLKRRRMVMLNERMLTACYSLREGRNVYCYHFGSQSEGTTTPGLRSDFDNLICHGWINVIQDWSQWKPGVENLLMIRDESTSPGYCLLQELRTDAPLPLSEHIPNGLFVRRGKVLCKNSIFNYLIQPGCFTHGPAHSPNPQLSFVDQDRVIAFHCESWPTEAQPWLERQGIGGWPTEEIKSNCLNTGCFVVPVASKSGKNKDTEWLISTSHAERLLMYSLNVTQIRCYILMKMILKTFINRQCDGVISSFMCKTTLFHCIQNTHSYQWQENNLLPCLTHCLLKLQHFIREKNCPHFIIFENNLMAEKITGPVKYQLLEILQHLIQSDDRFLHDIPYDDLGARLQVKINASPAAIYFCPPYLVSSRISDQMLFNAAITLRMLFKEHLNQATCCRNDIARFRLSGFIFAMARVYLIPDISCSFNLKKSDYELLFPLLCSSLGSVIASSDIQMHNTISQEAFAWLSAGLNSDVSSGRLKFASVLYCVGEIVKTEFVLRNIEDQYDQHSILPVCECFGRNDSSFTFIEPGFRIKSYTGNEEMITQTTAFCVTFMQCEKNCVPKELQYEMFRSTEDDRLQRDEEDYWMDWAAVDSLPYLYFLQYKIYGRLQRAAGQQCALTYLASTIDVDPNLGHRETAMNLLGQCMEQENRPNDALRCYMKSLSRRPRNNAAKIHICRLLNALVNRQVEEQ